MGTLVCSGSGDRVPLSPSDARRTARVCGSCNRELSVRIGRTERGPEATLPTHEARVAAGVAPSDGMANDDNRSGGAL